MTTKRRTEDADWKASVSEWSEQVGEIATRAHEEVFAAVKCDACGKTHYSPHPGDGLAREAAISAYNAGWRIAFREKQLLCPSCQ